MKTERDVFVEKLRELNYFSHATKRWDEVNNRFEHDGVQTHWEMWEASASREGYKLVPVEPTDEMIKAMKNGNDEGKHATWRYRCRLQYKAMIGAAP